MHQRISGQGRSFYDFFSGGFAGIFSRFHAQAAFWAGVLFLVFFAWTAHAQKGASISFLPDGEAKLTINEASAPSMAGEFQTYIPSFMAFSRLPDDFNGAVWLRFALGPSFERPSGPVRVDLGSSLPGISRLYTPKADGGFRIMESLPPQGVFVLPEDEPFPDVFYARIDGAPDLWFRPMIGPASAPVSGMVGSIPVHLILAGVFGFAMLLLLIRYVRNGEEWRLWAAITAGCGIVAAIVPTTPPAGQALAPLHAGAMMTPGLILVFFAHTARHLLASPKTMPGSDRVLTLYYLIGGALALLPLVPGFLWVSRCLPLAALLFIPLLPVGMISFSGSLKGGGAFLCACLMPVVGAAASSWEMTSIDAPTIGRLGGLFGTALGLLVLAFTGTVKNGREETESAADDVFDSLDKSCPSPDLVLGPVRSRAALPSEKHPEVEPPAEPAVRPAGQSAPATPGEETATRPEKTDGDTERYPELSLFSGGDEDARPEPEPDRQGERPAVASLKPAKQAPPLTPARPPRVSTPIVIADDGMETPADAPSAGAGTATPPFIPGTLLGHGRKILFDLPTLVKKAYDGPALIAERKGLGMSWYIAPHTGRLFEGEADLLDSALRQLLRDMVEAMDKGNVRLNVRRVRESTDAGHIVFTVSEWDARQTSGARTMAGLAEAWSLAEKTGGMFSVEHSPAGDTTVVFSAAFTAMDKTAQETAEAPMLEALPAAPADLAAGAQAVQRFSDYPDLALSRDAVLPARPHLPRGIAADDLAEEAETERDPLRVIVADTTASGRARAAAALANSPYSVLECITPPAAYALYKRHPSGLLVMNADMPEVDIAAAIKDVHADDERNGRSPAPFAILVEHERQANRMLEAGAARTLMKPVQAESLLALVTELLPVTAQAGKNRPSGPLPVPPPAVLPSAPPVTALKPEIRQPDAQPAPEPAKPEPAPETRATRTPPLHVRVGGSPAPRPAGGTVPAAQARPQAKPMPATDAGHLPKATVSVKPSAKTVMAQSKSAHVTAPAKPVAVPAAGKTAVRVKAAPAQAESGTPGAPTAEIIPKESPAKTGMAASPETVLHSALADIPPVREGGQKPPTESNGRTEAAQSGIFSTALPSDAPSEGEQPAKAGAASSIPAKRAKDEPGLGLLDMIITDEEEETTPAGPESEPKTERPASPAPPARNNAPQETRAKAVPAPSGHVGPASPAPASNQSRPEPKALEAPRNEKSASGGKNDVPGGTTARQGASILLPGEEDSIFKDMIPLVPGLIYELTDAMADAARGREEKSPLLVQQAAGRVAGKAESFGLTKLERMARCVERAAAADDIEPMECVLADLENWVARYKEALARVHREMQW